MSNTHIEVQLCGTLQGRIWMPACMAQMPINVNLTDRAKRYSDGRADFRRMVDDAINESGGDFQSCSLTDDSTIEVTLHKVGPTNHLTRTRYWPITAFPSIADMVVEREYFDDDGEG
ncbi:MAG: hypothetical protein ACSLE8_06260 [Rhodococcus sp. (in: high G+C Gram-positive bacteria)]